MTTTGAYSDFILPTYGNQSFFSFSQYPYHLATGSDGNIWFTEYAGGNVDRLNIRATNFVATGTNTTNFITEFFTPTGGSGPTAIASGGIPTKASGSGNSMRTLSANFSSRRLTITPTTNSQIVLSSAGDRNGLHTFRATPNLSGTNWINLTSPPPVVISNFFVYTNTVTNLDFFRLFLNTIP